MAYYIARLDRIWFFRERQVKSRSLFFCLLSWVAVSCSGDSAAYARQAEEAVQMTLEQAATAVAPQVVAYYQQIHRYPELGKKEVLTSKFVIDRLRQLGITNFVAIESLPTAVVAIFDSGRPGNTIALRSELDARPGHEETGLPFASTLPDRVHSCGHDAHAAILLGVAEVIVKHQELFSGKILFLFQPAEETAGGADDVVRDGLLTRLNVSAILAEHSAPGVPVGEFQVSSGPTLAGSNYFSVSVAGRGGHAAAPHQTDDVLTGTAAMVTELTRLPARSLDVLQHPCVISVTCLSAGQTDALNVLPSIAEFYGTLRSFDSIDQLIDGRNSIRSLFMRTLQGIAIERDLTIDVDLHAGSPPTINNSDLYNRLIPRLAQRIGRDHIHDAERGMFSEDFAYYTPIVPSLYFSLGIQKDLLGGEPVHSDKFTIHPDALRHGVRLLSNAAQLLTETSN